MINYMIGKVAYANARFIVFESNWVGYSLKVANPEEFEVNVNRKIYIYKHIKLDNKNNVTEELYGFSNLESKLLFLNLLTVTSIGPKTAINICKANPKIIKSLIASQNIEELKQVANINTKQAIAICSTLCESKKIYSNNSEAQENNGLNYEDLIASLSSIGYDQESINFAIAELEKNTNYKAEDLSDTISECIKIIASKSMAVNEQVDQNSAL